MGNGMENLIRTIALDCYLLVVRRGACFEYGDGVWLCGCVGGGRDFGGR